MCKKKIVTLVGNLDGIDIFVDTANPTKQETQTKSYTSKERLSRLEDSVVSCISLENLNGGDNND